MARLKLTPKGLDALTTEKPQADFWDTLTPGLHVRVSGKTGRKTWMLRYRANGKQRRMKLGTYPGVSLKEARDRARDAVVEVEEGQDPLIERREAQEAREKHTFGAMADEVLTARARKTREATQVERARILAAELGAWRDRPVSGISRREVVELVEAIVERGSPVLANRTLALIRLLFNDGIRRGFPTLESNPAHLVEPPGEESGRDRYLTATEVAAVWNATEGQPDLTRGAFRLALLTGQRIGSVLAMNRRRIEGDVWTIPAEHFKGGRPHLVPLSEEALAVLAAIPEIEGAKDWVFPSRAKAKKPYLTNVAGALARIRKDSRIPHWTAHDFRTTVRTHAVKATEDGGLGVAGHVADAVLGHKEASLGFDRYTGDQERYLLHEKREALRAWGAFVARAVGGQDQA